VVLRSYDQLQRPTHLWARDAPGDAGTLRERLIYGDQPDIGLTEATALARNLKGKLYQHYDEAGLLQIEHYDFKGNIAKKLRQVIQDSELLKSYDSQPFVTYRVDWSSQGAAVLLDHAQFETLSTPATELRF
jgi:hypothetical protein